MNRRPEVPPIEMVFSALADPTRRQLLDRLAGIGEATATTLAADMSVTRQAVVQHLAILEEASLVEGQRIGRERRFVVRPQRLTETARWMDRMADQWSGRLTAIKRLAEQAQRDDAAPSGQEASIERSDAAMRGQATTPERQGAENKKDGCD